MHRHKMIHYVSGEAKFNKYIHPIRACFRKVEDLRDSLMHVDSTGITWVCTFMKMIDSEFGGKKMNYIYT